MDVRECYQAMGGSYEGVMHRLASEDRVRRFLGLFLKDESFRALEAAVGGKDWEAAFRAAHTLKGITLNLNLDRLAGSTVALTEALRGGDPKTDPEPLFAQVSGDYRAAVDAIQALLGS